MNAVLSRILFLSLFIIIIGCDSHKERNVYYNQSFEDIYVLASETEWNCCIVLLDSTSEVSVKLYLFDYQCDKI